MLAGIISDTHGLMRPEAIAALQGSDLIIHAGDVGKPELIDQLNAIAPAHAVRGNRLACAAAQIENTRAGAQPGDRVAFCHSLNRVIGTMTQGKKIDMSWRAILCCRRIDGKWMVTHGHSSVPFDMESGKASLDLKP